MSVELQLEIRKRINMYLKKISIMALAVFAAAMMFAAPLVSMGSADDADAPVLGANESVNGTYTVFVNDGTSAGWQSQTVSAYDGAQAVQATTFWKDGDSMVARATTGSYPSLNATYGDVTTFDGKTEDATNVWNVYVYVNDEWVIGNDAIGFYRCFDDYASNWQTANIALQYGSDATSVPSELEEYANGKLSQITNVTDTSAFAVTFNLRNMYVSIPTINGAITLDNGQTLNATNLASGVTVTGYGSDAYLALKDALNVISSANVIGEETIPVNGYNNYSWIDTIFGLGTVQTQGLDTPSDWTDDVYVYWSQYDGDYFGTGVGQLSGFVLGAYSPLTGAPAGFSANEFSMIYAEVGMY